METTRSSSTIQSLSTTVITSSTVSVLVIVLLVVTAVSLAFICHRHRRIQMSAQDHPYYNNPPILPHGVRIPMEKNVSYGLQTKEMDRSDNSDALETAKRSGLNLNEDLEYIYVDVSNHYHITSKTTPKKPQQDMNLNADLKDCDVSDSSLLTEAANTKENISQANQLKRLEIN